MQALDLILGPDRLNRFPPIAEYDFYNSKHLIPAEGPEVICAESERSACIRAPGGSGMRGLSVPDLVGTPMQA